MNSHIDKNLFRFTEKCLRDYHVNLLELRRRKEYLEAISAISPTDFKSLSELGTEVDGAPECCALQSYIERADEDDDILRLRKRTEPITVFYSTLADNEKAFIVMRYQQCQSWREISEVLSISEDSARGYWRGRLVKRAARLLLGDIV